MNWIKATRLPIPYRNHHLRRPDIDIFNTDDMRKSLSKLKEGFKHRLGGKKHAADSAGADAAVETASPPASLTRPDPRLRDEEGSRISAEVSQSHSRDRSPQPEPMHADEGRGNPRGREAEVGEKEFSPSPSRLDPDVKFSAGSGPSRGIEGAPSPLSVTPITPEEPDGTRTFSPQQPCLITLPDNADTPAVPGRVQRDPRPDENAEPTAAANEKKSSWKPTALAAAKLLLRGVRDSADAFGPLKSVAGGLCFILENYEVRSSLRTPQGSYRHPANEGERTNDRIAGTPGEGTC